ncbi:hypothetical protein WK55_31635 [Burkholderia ubonensis]|uniref:tail fiber assembly protein n=1 Tax=Burkholderia ubonensis TaxID=101571 RepID=UPI000756C968|nr:tail fiber assembly protein [Burkholderia ubonensis]KVT65701.1 hypothetical protein WK55_31635 [Burkholderia ubonensis]
MKTYAHIQSNVVAEIIPPITREIVADDGGVQIVEVPITDRFHPNIVQSLVDVTDVSPAPDVNWTYDGAAFSAPRPPTLSANEVLAANTLQRDALLAAADEATAGMIDAYVAGLLDPADEEKFKAFAAYKLSLAKVDMTAVAPVWPVQPSY